MFSCGMPAPSAGCCLFGIWLGDQISSFPSLKCAVEFCGSSGACDSSGKKVLRFDGLRRRFECRLDVADHGAGRPAGTATPSARWRCRRWRRRGCGGRRLGGKLACLRQVPLAALLGDCAFVPDDLQRASRVVGDPPAVGHDRDARGERVVALPRRLDDERVLDARQLLDLVQVRADDLPAEDVALHQHRMEHVRKRDVDAEDRTTRHDVQVVDAADPLADDLEVARLLERGLDGGGFRNGEARRRRRQRRVGCLAFGRGMRDDASRRGQLALRDAPLLRRRGQHDEPAARPHQAHVLVVGGNRAAATFDLSAVLRVEVGLLDLHLRPVDVEFIGDDLRERGLDALPGLRILRDDREGVVGVNRDVGVRRERRRGAARTSAALLRQHVRCVEGDEQAAAGRRRDLQKRTTVECRILQRSGHG